MRKKLQDATKVEFPEFPPFPCQRYCGFQLRLPSLLKIRPWDAEGQGWDHRECLPKQMEKPVDSVAWLLRFLQYGINVLSYQTFSKFFIPVLVLVSVIFLHGKWEAFFAKVHGGHEKNNSSGLAGNILANLSMEHLGYFLKQILKRRYVFICIG